MKNEVIAMIIIESQKIAMKDTIFLKLILILFMFQFCSDYK